jgi:nitrogen fixation/metabolism regulation signal transduction histidine kinase
MLPNFFKFESNGKPLRKLLLTHELFFITLIVLAVLSGGYGIHMWDKASRESQRINSLVQEIYQVRGDLYRQMKELFDAFFLQDSEALDEYNAYTQSVLAHFAELHTIAKGADEINAVNEIERNYRIFVNEAPSLFYRYQAKPDSKSQKSIYKDIETGIFMHYEQVSKRAEILLKLKQVEIKTRLKEAKEKSIAILSLPLILSFVLLFFSRYFLKRSILNPINDMMKATHAISAGNLSHKSPEAGALELAVLSNEINKMAEDLSASRDALVRSEKQAAMGLLVPMLAHNIRNPLASIRATAQVIDVPEHDKDMSESLNGIIRTVDRLERWTGSLLSYLHPIKPQLSQVSLSSIVQGAQLTLEPKLIEKTISFEHNSADISELITTDEHLLEQMLYNLMLNAVEASPKDSRIQLHCVLAEDFLTLTLTDQGSGMPFKPDPHSVTPGPTTKRFGTGLGIPFAFKVCEELGGMIQFDTASTGTIITIQLPQEISAMDATYFVSNRQNLAS